MFLQSSFKFLSINQGFAFKPFKLTSQSWLYLFMMYFPAVRLSFPVLSLLFLDCETTWNISVKAVLLKIPCQLQRATKSKHREITWLNSTLSPITLQRDFIGILTKFILWHSATAVKIFSIGYQIKLVGKLYRWWVPLPFQDPPRSILSEFSQFIIQIHTILFAFARISLNLSETS